LCPNRVPIPLKVEVGTLHQGRTTTKWA
jgi:hypothetical protein